MADHLVSGALQVLHGEGHERDLEDRHAALVPEDEDSGGLDVDEEHREEVREHGREHELLEEEARRRDGQAGTAVEDHPEEVAAVGVVCQHAEAGVGADEGLGRHDVGVRDGAAQRPAPSVSLPETGGEHTRTLNRLTYQERKGWGKKKEKAYISKRPLAGNQKQRCMGVLISDRRQGRWCTLWWVAWGAPEHSRRWTLTACVLAVRQGCPRGRRVHTAAMRAGCARQWV